MGSNGLDGGLGGRGRSAYAENGRQQDEAVKETKYHYKEEYLKEADKKVRGGRAQKDKGQKGGEAAVEHRWAHVHKSLV
jgi:hypothetical protein